MLKIVYTHLYNIFVSLLLKCGLDLSWRRYFIGENMATCSLIATGLIFYDLRLYRCSIQYCRCRYLNCSTCYNWKALTTKQWFHNNILKIPMTWWGRVDLLKHYMYNTFWENAEKYVDLLIYLQNTFNTWLAQDRRSAGNDTRQALTTLVQQHRKTDRAKVRGSGEVRTRDLLRVKQTW